VSVSGISPLPMGFRMGPSTTSCMTILALAMIRKCYYPFKCLSYPY
jgi:hypothetical protein